MAHAAGVELDGLDAGGRNGSCVHVRVDVCLHDADFQVILQRLNEPGQGCGLSRAGGGHQIEKINALLFQFGAKPVCLRIVVGKDTLPDLQYPYGSHRIVPFWLYQYVCTDFSLRFTRKNVNYLLKILRLSQKMSLKFNALYGKMVLWPVV